MRPTNAPVQLKPANPRVVVRLAAPPVEEGGRRYAGIMERQGVLPWNELRQNFPGITLAKLFPRPEQNRFRGSPLPASATTPESDEENEKNKYYVVQCAPGTDTAALITHLKTMGTVVDAFVESGPMPPPLVQPVNDPYCAEQGYLQAGPKGIDAQFAWSLPGGDGEGTQVVDVEQGWNVAHEDLVEADIRLIHGFENDFHGHGTAVLGQIGAVDNAIGCIGIAPRATIRLASQWVDAKEWSTSQAIHAAAAVLRAGDVLLIEAQLSFAHAPNDFFPVEIEDTVFLAIKAATAKGIIVVEAGGNGAQDLDTYQDPDTGNYVLNRNHTDFKDSGAILVGAATAADPHERMWFSNFGSRIDCYGWGEAIRTTGDGDRGRGHKEYTSDFGGTSGASPIIAGAALCLQGMYMKHFPGRRLPPDQMRSLLADPALGTSSKTPASDRIGVMPDLRELAAYMGIASQTVAQK